MYAYRTKEAIPAVDFVLPERVAPMARWRSHPRLHRWAHGLYEAKGGQHFGLMPMRLDIDDMAALERAVVGVFDRHRDEDLAFIAAARRAVRAGHYVFLDSWTWPRW